jgi:hypothetical protein
LHSFTQPFTPGTVDIRKCPPCRAGRFGLDKASQCGNIIAPVGGRWIVSMGKDPLQKSNLYQQINGSGDIGHRDISQRLY